MINIYDLKFYCNNRFTNNNRCNQCGGFRNVTYGMRGPTGPTGPMGPRGATGPQGPQGPIGPQGPQGTNGQTIVGPTGATGATGAQGIQGIQGIQGEIGPTGPTGAQGIQGPIGATGATGPTGAQGIQGIQGVQGEIGPTGPTGAQGIQGEIGPTGPTGASGETTLATTVLTTSTGELTSDALAPLTEVVNTTGGDVVVGTNQLTLESGTYVINYSGTVTGTTGTATIALYQEGTIIPSTSSSATLATVDDLVTLSGNTVLNVGATTTLDLRNAGTTTLTINNLAITVTKIA